jgi:beta-glucosidase
VVRYDEGLLVGYRHYDKASVEPRFCFGHGLSYTRFDYGEMRVSAQDNAHVHVTLDVTNAGARRGREVVQLYVGDPHSAADRPDKQLRDFAKLELEPGQTQTVTFDLPPRAFAHWEPERQAWIVAPGKREIQVGSSSRDIRQGGSVSVVGA